MRARSLALLLAACLALGAASTVSAAFAGPISQDGWVQPDAVAASRSLLQAEGAADGASSDGPSGGYGGARRLMQSTGGYGGARRLMQSTGGYGGARRLMQSTGGYGGARRLMQSTGGYGGARRLMQSTGGYGGARRLMQSTGGYGGARRLAQSTGGYGDEGTGGYGRARRLGETVGDASAAAQPQQQQLWAGRPAGNVVDTAVNSARAAAASSLLSPAPGTCYCRYDTDYGTWALGEEGCKAALYAKCRAGQLPCDWLDAYYAGGGLAHKLAHEDDVQGFVFDDCQPQPPCACAGVNFNGADSAASAYACCRDLRAACRTPFTGLDCSDVEAFCGDDAPSSTPLRRWTQHKLHHAAECAAYAGTPYNFVSFEAMMAAHRPARGPAALGANQGALAAASAALHALADRSGAGATALAAAGAAAVLVAGAAAVLLRGTRARAAARAIDGGMGDFVSPLLHTIPEMPAREEAEAGSHASGVRRTPSSNYLMPSPPISRSASHASLSGVQ
ncbi:hypothetical protein Rsub_06084 [Raphidocelis subcapitata]|uniref:Uncharacterized protein n=1 Tax=Raphidocelis subcapitata TaxID=307507 RepID=A0A2V0P4B7_9CHLO|nr:hypothetical protein Rsub_06084 [Raphidocelis subcapitata]|eukprot:GBF93752.1 hypothetical protein Rsub_06084 [Raphidocelis subcapitata]